MIHKQIQADMIQAMKDKRADDKEVLSFLLSKIKNKAIDLKVEELPDSDSIQLIQKFVKSLEEERDSLQKANRLTQANKLNNQIKLIGKYLPQQIGKEEIREIINNLQDKSVPFVMKYFKENYLGKVDMKLVNQILKEI